MSPSNSNFHLLFVSDKSAGGAKQGFWNECIVAVDVADRIV